jgi:hypothetical protein
MTRYQQVSIRGDGRRRGRPQFAGWQALHVAIDDHSRLAFSRMLPNQQSETAIAFLHAAVAFYAQHGITIRRLLTDNGSCYRSRQFRAACLQLGIQHRFTRPYTPRTNGKDLQAPGRRETGDSAAGGPARDGPRRPRRCRYRPGQCRAARLVVRR